MPRTSRVIGAPVAVGQIVWEQPDPSRLLHARAPYDARLSTLLQHLAFYSEFNIPLDTTVYELRLGFRIDGHLYILQVTGTPIGPTSPPGAPRLHTNRAPEDGCPSLVAWVQRVFVGERPVSDEPAFSFELRWHPEAGITNRMCWWEGMPLATVTTHRKAALRLLKAAEQRGRPLGSSEYATREAFLHVLRPLIQHLQHEGRKPSCANAAAFYPGRTSPRQLYAWCKQFGMTWREVCKACTEG